MQVFITENSRFVRFGDCKIALSALQYGEINIEFSPEELSI